MYAENSWMLPNSETPYPTFLAAYVFAAVNAPETGILYISDWLDKQPLDKQSMSDERYLRRWHACRARSELKYLAAQYLRSKISNTHLLIYQRDLTDDFAALLNVKSEGGWQALCTPWNTLHAQIGRYLAFNYATARSQVFELQTMSQAQVEYQLQGRAAPIVAQLDKDIAEAKMLAKSGDCFVGVPSYDGKRTEDEDRPSKWLAQFQLNVIHLELIRMALLREELSETEAEEKRKQLERDLYTVSSRLGPIYVVRTADRGTDEWHAVDTLLKTDGFEDQRERVNSLLPILRKRD